MFVEADRPLRRLAADAVRLAKNETERLGEDTHGGKFGSIARSVNIHIDKLGRDAKSARTNLDQLLGPAPEGSLGTIDLLAGALPAARPGGVAPASSPAPSDFKFHDPGPATRRRTTAARSRRPWRRRRARPRRRRSHRVRRRRRLRRWPRRRAAPSRRLRCPPPQPSTAPLRLDDDILAPDLDEQPTALRRRR